MRVIFVSSGNSAQGVTSLIRNQGSSLKQNGVDIEFFSIKQRGIWGYLKAIRLLRKHLKRHQYDIIHAHYSYSGMMCSLSLPAIPVIVSLMGSDVKETRFNRISASFFTKYIWAKTIVKSEDLKRSLGIKKAAVIPNGVNLSHFVPMVKNECQAKLGWDNKVKHLLFAADPDRKDKNFLLTKIALEFTEIKHYQLHFLKNIRHDEVPVFMNATDALLLSSPYEGSPNVIKEAMACNCPIVSTDVGDVREVIGDTEGCYIAGFDPKSFAEGIRKALAYGKRTNGREKIMHLDSNIIAEKIINLYKEVIEQ